MNVLQGEGRIAKAALVLSMAAATFASAAFAAPVIVTGPYVQNMTQDAVSILWETDIVADSRVYYFHNGSWLSASDPIGRHIHEIRIGGFSAGQAVSYYVESAAAGQTTRSTQATYRTAPPTGTPFRMCTWGDNQERPEIFSQHVARMIADQPDLLLALGDVCNNGGVYWEWEDRFLGPLRPLIQYTPMIVSIGNHEGNSDWFYRLLAQPGNEHWFGYAYGNAYFVIVDSNFPFSPGSEQYAFIQQALFSPEAQSATWLFVAHHHPSYSEIHEEPVFAQIRTHLVPLYEQAGVDINFYGHIHAYERGEFIPPQTDRRIWYVDTSGGGGTLWPDMPDGDWWEQIDFVDDMTHHYCVVDVGTTELTLRAIDVDGNLIDTFTIEARPRGGQPTPCPDLNGDGQVDLRDLVTLLSNFAVAGAGFAGGDVNGDGEIELTDLAAMLSYFGTRCP